MTAYMVCNNAVLQGMPKFVDFIYSNGTTVFINPVIIFLITICRNGKFFKINYAD